MKTPLIILGIFFMALPGRPQQPEDTTGKKTLPPPRATAVQRNDPQNGSAKPGDRAIDFYRKGVEQSKIDDQEGAMESFNRAIQMDQEYNLAYLARGSVKFILQDYESAMQDFTRAIELSQTQVDAAKKRGNIKIILGDHRGATKEFNIVNSLQPVLGEAYYNRGNVRRYVEDNASGCEDLKKAVEYGFLKAYDYIKRYCQ